MAGVLVIIVRHNPAPPELIPPVPSLIPRPFEPDSPILPARNDTTQPPAVQTDNTRTVNPTYDLVELIKGYQEQRLSQESRKLHDLTIFIDKLLDKKEKGGTRWSSENWMKAPEYYQNLNTLALAEECFDLNLLSIFGSEMGIYGNNPLHGYFSLKIFHNGFAELFEREDFYAGLVHAYEVISSHITTQDDYGTIIRASWDLGHMGKIYTNEFLKDKIKGHEKELFAANYNTLLRYKEYLDERAPQGVRLGFFGEPTWVANVALMLARQLDPVKFALIEPEISEVRLSKQQIPMELKNYIDLVVERLKDFL